MERAIASLGQLLRTLAQKLELPALWRWWLSELAPLVPTAPRTAMQRRRVRPLLAFGKDTAVLWAPRVDNGALMLIETATIPLTGDAAAIAHAGRSAIAALPANGVSGARFPAKVVLSLPPSQVLRKRITLPAAVEENLRDTLNFDLDRHTPFRPDQLYFDAVVVGRDLAKKEIRVDWAAALKSIVDPMRRQAEDWGSIVVGVTPESIALGFSAVAAPSSWSKLNLLPHEERPYGVSWRRWQLWVPAAALAVTLIVAVGLPLWQKREYAIELSQVTEHARLQASAADALRQKLDQATDDYNFALGRKYAFLSSVQLLDDVTRLLPDDTWLTQLEVKSSSKGKEAHREMLLRGESANAGKLISALEDSKEFEQAAPRSPTTKVQPGPGEVFDLGSQLIPLPAPPLVALVNPVPHPAAESSLPAAGAPAASLAPAAAHPAAPAKPGATLAGPPAPAMPAAPARAAPTPGTPPTATPARAAPPPGTPPPLLNLPGPGMLPPSSAPPPPAQDSESPEAPAGDPQGAVKGAAQAAAPAIFTRAAAKAALDPAAAAQKPSSATALPAPSAPVPAAAAAAQLGPPVAPAGTSTATRYPNGAQRSDAGSGKGAHGS